MTVPSVPGVVFEAQARAGMLRGVNQLANLVRPTLGPCPRVVAVEHTFRQRTPELLDNAGVISRRVIGLPDRDADVGAMLLRNLLWSVHEEAGDCTATAAVLFQAVYTRGASYLAAGGDAMRLRRQLERGAATILAALDAQRVELQGKARLASLAETLCFDEPLAQLLGEAVDLVGPEGLLEIRAGRGRTTSRQYIEGSFWPGPVLSQQLFADQTMQRTDLADVAVLLSDLELDDPRALMPILTEAMRQGVGAVLVVGASIADPVTAMLIAASRDPRFRALAVRTPGAGLVEQAAALEDLAVLTGGRRLLKAAGDALRSVRFGDLGRARRAWGDRNHMGIIGGQGDPLALRRHLVALEASAAAADDQARRKALRERAGRLRGGAAILTIGGGSEGELTLREERARRTAELLRAALREGVLPGAGAALLACRAELRRELAAAEEQEAQVACRILLRAVEEPLRTLVANAGYEAPEILARLAAAGPGCGFDARSGAVVDLAAAGIYDVAAAVKTAVRTAICGAATALTVDTIVHRRNPEATPGRP